MKDSDYDTIVSSIRFELIETEQLLSVVRESSVLSEIRLLDVLVAKTFTEHTNYRSDCRPGLNVATFELNAKVSRGSSGSELLNGILRGYDKSHGFTYHKICGPEETEVIVVELGHIFMLNQIELLLWDLDNRSYSYYVEVSTNREQWRRVIDHTRSCHRSWQILYFEAPSVRYIKIVGTKNTEDDCFHVVHLAAYYKNKKDLPTLVDGSVSPTINVASKEKGAKVVKGDCRNGDTVDVLLNGNAINYTDHSR